MTDTSNGTDRHGETEPVVDEKLHALRAFEALAPLYDRFTQDDDYGRWGALLAQVLVSWQPPGKKLLDVGCGTGKSAIELARHGYTVTGCDVSSAMLDVASRKPEAEGIGFFTADMRALDSDRGSFDVVNCMDDGLNFLLDDADLFSAFDSAAQVLRPKGLYVFDCNTLHTYRTWYGCVDIVEDEDVFFAWRGHCTPEHSPGQTARADLYAYQRHNDDRWSRLDCPHVQRHHPPDRVRGLLAEAGLRPIATYGLHQTGMLREAVDEQADGKAIHVARKSS